MAILIKFTMSISNYDSNVLYSAAKGLYLDECTADVHFVFKSGNAKPERVPAHKILLMTTSGVFRTNFSGIWNEKKEVLISDATVAGFKEFLQFFYLDKIQLTHENIEEVTHLGKTYVVTECVKTCGQFLQDNLSVRNFCLAYEIATLFDIDELKLMCELYISVNGRAVLKSPGFLKCDQKTVGRILKLDTLSCREIEIFEACMDWVKAASKQDTLTKEAIRTHLGDSFYDIRFGSMNMVVFASISMTSIFTTEEHKDIVQKITTDTYTPKFFNKNRRRRIQTQILKCKRETSYVGILIEHPYHIKKHEITTFTSNENLLLRAIDCAEIYRNEKNKYYTPMYEDLDSHVTIVEIREINGEEVSRILYDDDHFKFNGRFNSSDDSESNDSESDDYDTIASHISLSEPIIIRRGYKYQIKFDQKIDDDWCTNFEYRSNCVEIKPGIVIEFDDEIRRMQSGVIKSLDFSEF